MSEYIDMDFFFVQDAWQCDICGCKSGRGFGKYL